MMQLQRSAGNAAVTSLLAPQVTVRTHAWGEDTAGFPAVLQRVDATVFAGTTGMSQRGDSSVGMGAGGDYASHAERLAWAAAKASVTSEAKKNPTLQFDVQFDVGRGVCHHCQLWFENVLLAQLANWDQQFRRTLPSRLFVKVKRKSQPAQTLQIVRGATPWNAYTTYSGSIHALGKKELKAIKSGVYG